MTLRLFPEEARHSKIQKFSKHLVCKWHRRFSKGWTDCSSRGRPPFNGLKTVDVLKNVIDGYRRKSAREITPSAGRSKSTGQLTEDLKMWVHGNAPWVPMQLSNEEKLLRATDSRKFLRKRKADPTYFPRIIMTDETLVLHYEPEDNWLSNVWKHLDSPPSKKAKQSSLWARWCAKYLWIAVESSWYIWWDLETQWTPIIILRKIMLFFSRYVNQPQF